MPLTTTPTAFETMPDTMYLTETISAVATSMTLNYVPLAITSGIMILDEGTDREERVSFAGVTDNGDGTATYTDMRRGLAFGGGTAYAASIATAYEHTGNSSTARLVLAHEYMNKSMFTDRNNLLDANVEIRFGSSTDSIYGDGNELYFKSQTTAAKSLAQLAAAGGSDEKVKISINDTTSNYLLSKLTGGDGILLSEVDDGSDESIDIDLDLATDPGLEITSQKVRVKVKTSGGITRDSDGLSLDATAIPRNEFGNGSDGSYTLNASQAAVSGLFSKNSTDFTLLKDAQFINLTIESGYTLNTNGFMLRWSGTLDLQGSAEEQIYSNGGNGGNGGAAGNTDTPGTAGTAGSKAHTGNTIPDPVAGKAGGAGGRGGRQGFQNNGADGSAGTAGTSVTKSVGSNGSVGVAGASGGAGSVGTGGAGGGAGGAGTATAPTALELVETALRGYGYFVEASDLNGSAGSGSGGGGGGGGKGSDGNPNGGGSGGGGGGSGGAGGNMDLAGNIITGAGNIAAKGGAGGNGGAGGAATFTNGGGGGGGSGGSGGDGGFIRLAYRDKSGWTGTTVVTGGSAGTGGAAGAKDGTGTIGNAGSSGTAGGTGTVYEFQFAS